MNDTPKLVYKEWGKTPESAGPRGEACITCDNGAFNPPIIAEDASPALLNLLNAWISVQKAKRKISASRHPQTGHNASLAAAIALVEAENALDGEFAGLARRYGVQI
jgi:hypothetical protein